MFVPLTIVLGFILYMFTTWVKLRVVNRDNKYKYKLDEKLLSSLRQNPASKEKVQEVLEELKRKRTAENQTKVKATQGKSFFDQMDELKKGKGQHKTRTFDPDMFHDPVSRMYHESDKAKVNVKDPDERCAAASVLLKALEKGMKSDKTAQSHT